MVNVCEWFIRIIIKCGMGNITTIFNDYFHFIVSWLTQCLFFLIVAQYFRLFQLFDIWLLLIYINTNDNKLWQDIPEAG